MLSWQQNKKIRQLSFADFMQLQVLAAFYPGSHRSRYFNISNNKPIIQRNNGSSISFAISFLLLKP
jgi:hypothetical protein